jgi:hypothetical protein
MNETYFYRAEKDHDFTVMNNTHLRDDRLTWRARGIFSYILSLPCNWKIHITEIQKHAPEGRDAVYKAVSELEQYGYIKRTRVTNEKGRFAGYRYDVIEKPETGSPFTEKPYTEKPKSENPTSDLPKSENPPLLITDDLLSTDLQREPAPVPDAPPVSEPSHELPEEAKDLAFLLATLHGQVDPKYSVSAKQKESWAADIDRIHRLDGREWRDIEEVIRWAKQPGGFWLPNIMSGKKLREKYPTLWAQMSRPAAGVQKHRIAADANTGGEW